ncbi:MAG TPA: FAD-dependent oxidoreductase [Verrucomicrobiae bacterium]|nr:FAD-dependent oxidoreductase [Verrucomicrobiae bacterium]
MADVCVYGATPGGILAAVAVRRGGHSVVIVEPSRWVGGMLGAGLKPMQDCPNYAATGGLTRELLRTLGSPEWEGDHVGRGALSKMNPDEVRRDFERLLGERGVPVIFEHRIAACDKRGARIREATFDLAPFDALGCPVAEPKAGANLRVSAKIFIDASYEGDMMPRAGVSWRVGRESAGEFGEESAGVQPPMEEAPIDPFVVPGDPSSGLLKWVEDAHDKAPGAADEYTQAYNYRYYTTDDPARRIPLTPPDGYDPSDFELVGRYVKYLVETSPDEGQLFRRLERIFPGWLNSGEWNYHRESLFSMAPVGISHRYAAGDAAEKARVWKQHQDYLRGLHAFMSTDARVPEAFRRRTAAIGLDGRFHADTGGWPHQLYIRVARRLVGRYTITAHDVYNRANIEDPIGLAQYGIDTYPARRIWFRRDGRMYVGLEGKMFVGGSRGPTDVPYPIPYRAITPRPDECDNLLVPVCFSASHLGYASARMEPVFMICGESAGIAAVRALDENAAVQQIDPAAFRGALGRAGQKLAWDGPVPATPRSGTGGRGRPLTFEVLLEGCDRDGDGLVSAAEWGAGKPGWGWLFPVIDADGDGRITAVEYKAFQEYKAKNPDWAKCGDAAADRLRGDKK